MLIFIIAFLLGILYLQTFAYLPSIFYLFKLIMVSFLLWIGLRKYCSYAFVGIAFTLGFLWCTWYAGNLISWSLPKELEGEPLRLTGYVASIPATDNWGTNFIFALEEIQHQQRTMTVKANVRIAWRDHQNPLKVGDKWQIMVRLKRLHTLQNPGTFDYEAWALQKGLRAKGYVLNNAEAKLLSHSWWRYPIDQLRQRIQTSIQLHLPTSATAPWLLALMIGERNGIAGEQWQVLRATGTNHLMAIAGLHIGIMAGFAHHIVAWLWCRTKSFPLLLPASQAGAYAALIIAILYSALAGFSIPTERACIMLTIFILNLLTKRKINIWHAWSLALFTVLLLNPLSVLSESFWLSFGTIALIIYGMSGRLAPTGFWWKWGRVQWVIGLGLIPLTLSLFQECSLISFVANSIAIPWLGFFILPFCFLSLILLLIAPSMGEFFLFIADKNLTGLWTLLTWLSQLHFSSLHHAIPHFGILILTLMASLLLLLPTGFPGRWLGLIWFLPLLLHQPDKPNLGDFWLTVLDVGQGLSVIVQTKEHILIYDTGPKYNANYDMGESIVLPYLRSINAKKIDMLVISHGDNDHIGGADAVLKSLLISSIKTSTPKKLKLNAIKNVENLYCLMNYSWKWDDVDFTFLHPSQDQLNLGNNSSCVLQVRNKQYRILLTGDIEKKAEKRLVRQIPQLLSAHILIAPHHGSKTSALNEFIQAVNPQYVLYATGYRNRYHFPHRDVILAYEKINARQLNTVDTGTMQFKLKNNKSVLNPSFYRISHRRYWMD